jgi:hypothetical protein
MNERSLKFCSTRTRMHGFAFFIAVSALAALLVSPRAEAQDGAQCSNATLKGEYASYISGVRTVLDFATNSLVRESFVGISIRRYDGNGNFTEEWASFHGAQTGTQGGTAQPLPPGSGNYTVNSNCTGTSTLNPPIAGVPPIVSDFVIMDNAKEVREIVTAPSTNVVNAVFKRVR